MASALERFRSHDEQVIEQAVACNPVLKSSPEWIRQLILATDEFLFARQLPGNPESVIAGYPWFGDWGRDTMIALPGLTLATGRHDTALHILETFATLINRGMLPNYFPGDGDTPEYNTVDAALWYVEAWRAYFEATGDLESCRRVFPVLEEVLRCYREGTRYGIRMDPADGLIVAGAPGVPLTWMDARVLDQVFTPRSGKPVEVNALWYNALRIMAEFAELLELPGFEYQALSRIVRTGFQRFVRPGGGLFTYWTAPRGMTAASVPIRSLR
jgi:4-alpha-glucanotransferase